jgi:hypothetical protein
LNAHADPIIFQHLLYRVLRRISIRKMIFHSAKTVFREKSRRPRGNCNVPIALVRHTGIDFHGYGDMARQAVEGGAPTALRLLTRPKPVSSGCMRYTLYS